MILTGTIKIECDELGCGKCKSKIYDDYQMENCGVFGEILYDDWDIYDTKRLPQCLETFKETNDEQEK